MQRWSRAWSTALQVPIDLCAMLALTVLSAALARKFKVRIRSGWLEPINIYTITALAPGEGKSPVFDAAVEPLEMRERLLMEQAGPEIAKAMAEHQTLEQRLRRLQAEAAKRDDELTGDALKAVQDAAVVLNAHVVPIAPRLVVDDCTPERLGTMLADQSGRMALLSDEGGIVEIMAGRYSKLERPTSTCS